MFKIAAYLDPFVFSRLSDEEKSSAEKLIIAFKPEQSNLNKNSLSSSSVITSAQSDKDLNPNLSNSSKAMQLTQNNAKCKGFDSLFQLCGLEKASPATKTKTPTIRQEIAIYKNIMKNQNHCVEIGYFWNNQKDLNLLSEIANHFLIIMATSVASESTFSLTGFLQRKERSALSAEWLKYQTILKDAEEFLENYKN